MMSYREPGTPLSCRFFYPGGAHPATVARMNGFARRLVNLRTISRADRVLREVLPSLNLPTEARVLELGMGRGGLVALVSERLRPALYVGTDFDPDQVRAAREFISARFGSIPAPIALGQADARELPFKDRAFDCVFALMALHHVEPHHGEFARQPAAVREVRRVLRPGGWLVYKEFSKGGRLRRSLEDLGFGRVALHPHFRTETGVYRTSLDEGNAVR